MKRFLPLRISLLLFAAIALASCGSMKEGVVVAKSRKAPVIGTYAPPEQTFWVDVEGTDGKGRTVTRRVQLFDWEWKQLRKGDRIALEDYGTFNISRTPEKGARRKPASKKPRRKPATPKAKATPRPAATAASPRPASTPAASPAAKPPLATPPPPKPTAAQGSPSPVANRQARYQEVEARALEDGSVRQARAKVHTARSNDEQARALTDFHKAKFNKMREIDGSLADMIDRDAATALKSSPGTAASPAPR